MTTHSSILTWRIPWTEAPGGLQSVGSQESATAERVQHHRERQAPLQNAGAGERGHWRSFTATAQGSQAAAHPDPLPTLGTRPLGHLSSHLGFVASVSADTPVSLTAAWIGRGDGRRAWVPGAALAVFCLAVVL